MFITEKVGCTKDLSKSYFKKLLNESPAIMSYKVNKREQRSLAEELLDGEIGLKAGFGLGWFVFKSAEISRPSGSQHFHNSSVFMYILYNPI